MAREEKCILTNMCMVYDGDQILVQDRMDPEWPGITFPGGHVEPNESFVESVVREVKEETGLDISGVRLCGVKQWTHQNGLYRYIVFLFKTNRYSGELKSSDEGKVFWIDKKFLPTDLAKCSKFSIMMSCLKPIIGLKTVNGTLRTYNKNNR